MLLEPSGTWVRCAWYRGTVRLVRWYGARGAVGTVEGCGGYSGGCTRYSWWTGRGHTGTIGGTCARWKETRWYRRTAGRPCGMNDVADVRKISTNKPINRTIKLKLNNLKISWYVQWEWRSMNYSWQIKWYNIYYMLHTMVYLITILLPCTNLLLRLLYYIY